MEQEIVINSLDPYEEPIREPHEGAMFYVDHNGVVKSYICFYHLTLKKADFGHWQLPGVQFQECTFKEALFYKTKLQNAMFINCDLRGATFQDADLTDAEFANCNLSSSSFIDADCTGTSFPWSNLTMCDFEDALLNDTTFDFSAWPLWCGSLHRVTVDERLARQLLYHAFAVASPYCKPTKEQLDFINRFHQVNGGVVKRLEYHD